MGGVGGIERREEIKGQWGGQKCGNMLLLSRHSWRNFGELALTIIPVKKIIIAIFDFYFYNSRRLGGGMSDG